jgi:phospholipid/cholesterol/gamma-HCH transport system substrate-binding protein
MANPKRRERFAELAVGVLFFIGLAALAYVTVLLSHRDLLGRQTTYRAMFDSVGGLRVGERILVRGMEAGKVGRLKFEDGRVQVILIFDQKPTIHEDYKLRIRQSSVLGGRFVELNEGTPDKPIVPQGTVLEGAPAFDPMADMEELIGGMGDAMVWLRDALREGGLIENLGQAGKDVSALVAEVREGTGTIGLLIQDPTLYQRTVAAVDGVALFTEELREATGTLPRLIRDPSLYESAESLLARFDSFGGNLEGLGSNLDAFVRRLDTLSAQIAEGTGTVARLLKDPSLYDDVQATAANMKTLTGRLVEGEGTIGKVLSDDGEIYRSLQNTLANLEAVSANLRDGTGTLGKILSDDGELYASLENAMKNLEEASKAFGEQGGTLGKIMSDEGELYDTLHNTLKNLEVVSASMSQGEGTMGRLLTDEELYEDIQALVAELRAVVEDFREQTPVTTFGGIMLGAF